MIYVPANDNIINTAQIVDKRVMVPSPATPSGWTTLSKAADQSKTSNTTLADDNTLFFTMAASTKYRIRGMIFVAAASGTPGFKYSLTGPASPTIVDILRVTGNTAAPAFSAPDVAYVVAASLSLASAPAPPGSLAFDAIVHNGTNAGTFSLQWAQVVSDANATTVRAGSYIEYKVA
jgi:hypothetical protein